MKVRILIAALLLSSFVEAQNPVVLELFTSQGCSSCPSADRYFTTLKNSGRNVILLSYHVDYWDRLGWKDTYSSAEYSDRQRLYAKKMRSSRVYTPQIIVNGREDYVGSHAEKINAVLDNEQDASNDLAVSLSLNDEGKETQVEIKLKGQFSGTITQVAVVEDDLTTKIERGENAGRTITYNSVVRFFESIESDESNKMSLKLPSNLDPTKSKVIVFVQKADTFEVIASSSLRLKS